MHVAWAEVSVLRNSFIFAHRSEMTGAAINATLQWYGLVLRCEIGYIFFFQGCAPRFWNHGCLGRTTRIHFFCI